MSLDELRKEIDRIDEEIVRLIGERAEIARRIGEIKRGEGVGAYSPERERAVYDRVSSYNKGPLPASCIRAIYREIMAGAIALQKRTAIACLGPAGAPSHAAAREKFGAALEYVECADIAGVFQAVSRGEADYGVVPIENGPGAGVSATMDRLADDRSVSVISEAFLPVGHALLAHDVQTSEENIARFFVIGRQSTRPTGRDKTSLLVRLRDEAGSLHRMIEPFAEQGIDLTRIESRPSKRPARRYSFFLDLEGHVEDEPVKRALAGIERLAGEVVVLGSYPAAGP